ncbi:MAG: zinc ribbon domain-containing protein [Candidatus Latescibacterota bacterium]|nr:MAG: zinc ribbon domain-containing protein [Candidatus Latescibacterota bacterium]
MMEEPVKVCSQCGEEYSIKAEVCADCGGTLVLPQDYEKRHVPLAEGEEVHLVREGPVGYLQELEVEMKKKGIRAVIQFLGGTPGTCPSKTRYGLYVRPNDLDAAKEIDHDYWIKGAPDKGASFRYDEQELKGVCPACDTAIPDNTVECPECGLVVRYDDDVATCPECNTPVGDEIEKCPKCGTEFE